MKLHGVNNGKMANLLSGGGMVIGAQLVALWYASLLRHGCEGDVVVAVAREDLRVDGRPSQKRQPRKETRFENPERR